MSATGNQRQRLSVSSKPLLSVPEAFATVKMERWWKAKAANLMAILYSVMLICRLPFPRAMFLASFSVITIAGIGSFGHVINDWCDIDADAAAGKSNRLAGLVGWQRYLLAVALLAVALLPWLALPFDSLSIALLLLEFALLLAYSISPLRLKERPILAVLADAGYAYAVPALLAAHTFFLAGGQAGNKALLGTLLIWQFGLGVRHFLNHLALDRSNDLSSGTVTLATQRGNWFIHRLIRGILTLELLSFAAYLVILARYARILVLVITGLFLVSISFQGILLVSRRYAVLSCRFSKNPADRLYQDILALVLVSGLVIVDWRFSLLLGLHVILFYGADAGGFVFGLVALPLAVLTRGSVSPGVLAPRGNDEDAGLMPRASHHPRDTTRKARGRANIAVVNINRAKYTETFVQGVVARLNYNVYYLYGGELPRYDEDHRHFLPYVQTLAQLLEAGLRLEQNHFLKNSIASYLQAKRIRLVLAEFGPVGAEMLPIARDIGVPLIVCFHGYDVFHKQTVRQCAPRYQALFREAARIVGVSEVMLDRLEQLGAPREKLFHLPAFIDLEMFPYSDRSRMPPRFLAVGRFAETKSPHLTILAFQQVVRRIPQATLVMVGKGGGGELFEACVILVKALGLGDRVEFKGVLSHEEVAAQMRNARLFVQHSVTTPENGDMEGKPVAIMEAMASGLPVIATHHSGIRELIENDVTGILVPEYDVEKMAEAMIRLAEDDDLVRRLGRSASDAIHNHPLIARHVEILDGLIAETIARA
jgi:glycosyltransferase involved in cell wall biosynthesis